MVDLIPIPLKKPSEVDVATPLKNIIVSRYSTADKPEDYTDAIGEFAKLRSAGLWRAFEKYESSLDGIYRWVRNFDGVRFGIFTPASFWDSYCDQLTALETKIPAQEIQVPFKWRDAFDKGSIFGGKSSLSMLPTFAVISTDAQL